METAVQASIIFLFIFAARKAYTEHMVTIPNETLWRLSPKDVMQKILFCSLAGSLLLTPLSVGTKKEAQNGMLQFVMEESTKYASEEVLTKGLTYTANRQEVVYYNQEDPAWGQEYYGTSATIAVTGCGPTTLAMVVSTLTSQTIDPKKMADWAYANGYCAEGNGSYHTLIGEGAEAFGLEVEMASAIEGQKIADALAEGKLVIALMGKGSFTGSGHFIVLHGITEDGNVFVADPKSTARSQQEWPLGLLLKEAKGGADSIGPFWIVSIGK